LNTGRVERATHLHMSDGLRRDGRSDGLLATSSGRSSAPPGISIRTTRGIRMAHAERGRCGILRRPQHIMAIFKLRPVLKPPSDNDPSHSKQTSLSCPVAGARNPEIAPRHLAPFKLLRTDGDRHFLRPGPGLQNWPPTFREPPSRSITKRLQTSATTPAKPL
jgi:hypothetical protein